MVENQKLENVDFLKRHHYSQCNTALKTTKSPKFKRGKMFLFANDLIV